MAPDWITAISTAVLAAVTAPLVIFGWRQLRQAKEDHDAEARPYVVVDLTFRSTLAMIEVRNIGKTPAYDVEITFDQPLASTAFDEVGKVEMLNRPIPMLAPGRSMEAFFDSMNARLADDCTLPTSYIATVAYRGMRRKRYDAEHCIIDFKIYSDTAIAERGIAEIAKSLEATASETKHAREQLAQIAKGVDRIASRTSAKDSSHTALG